MPHQVPKLQGTVQPSLPNHSASNGVPKCLERRVGDVMGGQDKQDDSFGAQDIEEASSQPANRLTTNVS